MNDDVPSPAQHGLVLASLWLVMFTASSQFLVVAPILPRVGEALAVPEEVLGTLVSGYAVAVASAALIAGPISDAIGRRAILRLGSGWMAGALLLHYFADSYFSLLGLRILTGISSGIMAGATVAYVGDVIPYERRGRALGIVMSGMAFGQILGIPLGTVLADWWGFQAPFTSFGALMTVAFGLMMTVVPLAPPGNGEQLTVGRALRNYVGLLREGPILAISVASATMMLSVSAFIVYQPLWLETTFKVSPNAIASLFFVGGVANAMVGPFAGALSDRIGRKWMVVFGSLGIGLSMGITPWIPSFEWAYPLFFLTMVLVGARMSPLNALMTAMVGIERRGMLMSLTMATGQAGFALGAAAAGWTYASAGYAGNALVAALGAALTALLLAIWVDEPVEESVAENA